MLTAVSVSIANIGPHDSGPMKHTCNLLLQASRTQMCQTLLQAPEPHSDSRAAPASISWELNNEVLWEAVLDTHQTRFVLGTCSNRTNTGRSTAAW